MGKRSRKRGITTTDHGPVVPGASASSTPRAPRRKASLDELPPAPWSPFPLVELCVLLGLILIGIGFVAGGDKRGVFIVVGVSLAALAGLEQALREHLAGFRSHTSLLAGVLAAIVLVVISFTGVLKIIALVAALATFGAMFFVLRRRFSKASGGLTFRA